MTEVITKVNEIITLAKMPHRGRLEAHRGGGHGRSSGLRLGDGGSQANQHPTSG